MAKNMAKFLAKYLAIYGHILAINVLLRAALYFFFIDASARDGGRAGRRAGALASMKKKRVFAGLDPKMTPRRSKNFPSISAQ